MKAKAKKVFGCAGFAAALATASSMMAPMLAFASEEKTGIALILPDMNEFIPMVIAFIIVAIILAKFGWPVVDNIITTREEHVREALKKSSEAQAESERVLAEYQQQLKEAKAESAQIIADARATGEALKDELTAQAQSEAADMIAKAKAAIEAEKNAAMRELQGSVADTSVAVAAKLIGNDLTDDDHRKIIERYVSEAGSFNAN